MRPGGGAASAAVIAEVARRAAAAAAPAGVALPAARALVGAAGAGRAAERDQLAAALATAGVARGIRVVGDGELALAAAFGDGPGILVNAGTGSIAYARDAGGALHRAGGYGWQMSDEGGGYWLGRRALAAAGRAHDGRDEQSTLPARLLGALGLKEFDDLVRWSALATPAQIAGLAEHVLNAAHEGERGAQTAVDEAAGELVGLVQALERHFAGAAPAPVPLATTGGVLRAGTALATAFQAHLARAVPRVRIVHAALDPSGVAAALAARPG
jgi:N-acetylglucosamine kinase-like BadF-type ATPase